MDGWCFVVAAGHKSKHSRQDESVPRCGKPTCGFGFGYVYLYRVKIEAWFFLFRLVGFVEYIFP